MAKHNTLITSAAIHYTVKDFTTLSMHHILNDCLVAIEANGIVVVTNVLQNGFGNINGINFSMGSDFTGNNEYIGSDKAFARDL